MLFVLAAIAAVLLLCSCKPKGAAQSLAKPPVEPAAQAIAPVTAAQVARESLARALAAPAAANGLRLAWYCPSGESAAKDDCFNARVTAELLDDIGRRTRQGAGVLTVEAAPPASPGQAGADCPGQVNVLSFKLVATGVFPKGAIQPMLKSSCYSLGSQAKLTDCQCLGNVRAALAGLAAEAKARGAVLAVLDARRFGVWESGPTKQDEVTVDAPGFDLVYALIPKPKDFDAAPPVDFVSAAQAQAKAGGAGVVAADAPPLRIELPDAAASAAPALDAGAEMNKTQAKSDDKKSDSKKDSPKSGSKDKVKKKSKSKATDKEKDKAKAKNKKNDKDKPRSANKQPAAAA